MKKRMNFFQLFRLEDNAIRPMRTVRIAGLEMGTGVRIGRGGIWFDGNIDLHNYIGHDFEVDEREGVYVMTGIY